MAKTDKKNRSENTISPEKWTKKLTWPEELWNWVHDVIEWTWDAVLNTIAATAELARAWTLKIAKIARSKDPEIREIRGRLVNHHLKQSKESAKRIGKWSWKATKWTIHTTKWALRTALGGVYASWKDTITWLRNEKSDGKTEKTPKKKSKK